MFVSSSIWLLININYNKILTGMFNTHVMSSHISYYIIDHFYLYN